jgi:two-component system CheB/CheR fusion protein
MPGRRTGHVRTESLKLVPAAAPNPKVSETEFRVVGIGASAGGLEACTKFLNALPTDSGLAYILVQHLDPHHQSMLVELLGEHTALTVRLAEDGMRLEREHLYIIPPATYLTVRTNALHLAPASMGHGARLPFDILLRSMAEELGARAVCIVLSGTGSDGSAGLLKIKAKGGLVIVQEPGDASYDGMPRSAIETGVVDLVLPVASIPDALLQPLRHIAVSGPKVPDGDGGDGLQEIIGLLRSRTAHDFTHYKTGTLRRRIERRMSMASVESSDMGRYVMTLKNDPVELEQLAKDLLIHITQFFRDTAVFDYLVEKPIPDLVRECPPGGLLRIWVPGCSTGEEAYSLGIALHEQIVAVKSNIKLQVFASDVDESAVATAREGLYPASIADDVSPEHLARFFNKEDGDYRVTTELRAMVIFTVQDVLTDPPFSRLDLISCRNLMIYLTPEAQRRLVALFHFALKPGGILLLGNSEVVSNADGRFELIGKEARLYRHIGQSRPGEVDFAGSRETTDSPAPVDRSRPPSRKTVLADFCRQHALETHTPATVLTNRGNECLYSLGPTERYLRVASGHATLDVLAMVGEELRPKLRTAMQRANQENAPVNIGGCRTHFDGKELAFRTEVHPVQHDDEELLLIYFVDEPATVAISEIARIDMPRVAELEAELALTKTDLRAAVRGEEIAIEAQKSVSENALSVNEEYQSTNEELLTSKEELQSLNEELGALNNQLQATLERQRTTSDDLQNVLYSTDVAKLVLDSDLNIRFFTPHTKALYHIIKTDIGRPIADLHSEAIDSTLRDDALAILKGGQPVEREIETHSSVWTRKVLPYRTHHDAVEGVVITYTDITERKLAAEALVAAKQDAELANVAKSRFLASASHDLRQPMQTLSILQGLLASRLEGTECEELVVRLDDTLGAMSGMLNTLLDINQIEAGVVSVETVDFEVDDILVRLKNEFTYHAQAKALDLRVITNGMTVRSDPRLLEQMLRNLVSNALKYTEKGKVLIGCRRRGPFLSIEVWDTGVGIPQGELKAIFEEYYQLHNAARERSRGLGLGLSVVQRLGDLLGHRVQVSSRPGRGSGFSIEVPIQVPGMPQGATHVIPAPKDETAQRSAQPATVLVVEDEPELRELLVLLLLDKGYRVLATADGPEAIEIAANGSIGPDLILTDYNLPKGMNGLTVIEEVRAKLGRKIPAIILTGDISTETLTDVADAGCRQLNKPVKPSDLTQAIQDLLASLKPYAVVAPATPTDAFHMASENTVFIIDDDQNIRDGVRTLLEEHGSSVETFASSEAFLASYRQGSDGCLLVDAYLPGMNGLDLIRQLRAGGDALPAIMMTGQSDVRIAVHAMQAGAADFIEKPISAPELLTGIERALETSRDIGKLRLWRENAAKHIASLTPRQHEIMDLVLAGHPSKNIAADLGIAQRTVENHRAAIMDKTGAKSLPALARLALAAVSGSPNGDAQR